MAACKNHLHLYLRGMRCPHRSTPPSRLGSRRRGTHLLGPQHEMSLNEWFGIPLEDPDQSGTASGEVTGNIGAHAAAYALSPNPPRPKSAVQVATLTNYPRRRPLSLSPS
jgi:hypothetical protein